MFPPAPHPTPTSWSLPEPGWEQAARAIGRKRKPKGAGGGGDTGSEMLPPQPHPHPCFPSHALRGRRFGGAVGGLQQTDNPSHSLVGRGSGPLLAPSASAAACAIRLASPAQPSRLGSQTVPALAQLGVGVGWSLGSVKGSAALFYFSVSPLLSEPWSFLALRL